MLDNLQHRNTEYPFFFFDPRFIKTPGGIWWKDKTKVLRNEVPLKVLSKNIAVVEWFPYKSDKFKYPGKRKRVASQEYSFNLVSEAMDRGALIIISRSVKLWEESVPELQNYNRKLTLSSAQNVVITPNNLLLNREKTTAAWEMLLEAVNS